MSYTLFDHWLAWKRFDAALGHLKANSRVCDVGCGLDGEFLQFACQHKHITLGIGLDYQMPQRLAVGTYAVRSDITVGFPLRSGLFDHVVMLAVLEHLGYPLSVLAEVYRVLAPGGSLVMTWPNSLVDPLLAVLRKTGIVGHEMESDQHQQRIPLPRLQAMLREIGFDGFEHGTFELGLNNVMVAYKPA